MFARYKKSETAAAKPVPADPVRSSASGPAAPQPMPKPVLQPKQAQRHPAAQVTPVDKERKRKERIGEIKVELHKRLLDSLNLAALDRVHPGYGWARNAGYGTAEHLAALGRLGPSVHHRAGFAPVRTVLASRESG